MAGKNLVLLVLVWMYIRNIRLMTTVAIGSTGWSKLYQTRGTWL